LYGRVYRIDQQFHLPLQIVWAFDWQLSQALSDDAFLMKVLFGESYDAISVYLLLPQFQAIDR
jgi:hypothetical protein